MGDMEDIYSLSNESSALVGCSHPMLAPTPTPENQYKINNYGNSTDKIGDRKRVRADRGGRDILTPTHSFPTCL